MRHRKAGKQLNRNAPHRRAMFANMCASIIEHERIKTTLPKAKELRRFAEPLITIAKEDSVANRRLALRRLNNNKAPLVKLFTELGVRYKARPGGYIRILKAGFRRGDSAPMAWVQLVTDENTPPKQAKTMAPLPVEHAAPAEDEVPAPPASPDTASK